MNSDKAEQTGRSMIEMLGVLAVMGVLSVGGIYGYSTAMTRHKANEIVHSISAANIGLQAGQSVDFLQISDVAFQTVGKYKEKPAYIQVDITDKSVCKAVKLIASGAYYIEGDCE